MSKEPVRTISSPWLVGGAVAVIGVLYFALLGTSEYPEPGESLNYDVEIFAKLDDVPTRYTESAPIAPKVEDPQGMAIGPDGRLYVTGQDAVVIYEDRDETGRFSLDGNPKCIHVAKDGTIFLGYATRVEVADGDGTIRSVWDDFNSRSYLTSIATYEDNVFVGDAGNRVVLRFNRDGELLGRIGERDEAMDVPGLEVPSPYLDLAVNEEGHLWVVNPGKLGFERYRHDGEIVTSWYRPTLELEGFSGCCNPTQMTFMNDGRLLTAEKGLVRIKTYEVTSGEFLELVAGSKLFARIQSMSDLVVDQQDRILVLDPRDDLVRVFQLDEDGENGKTSQPA